MKATINQRDCRCKNIKHLETERQNSAQDVKGTNLVFAGINFQKPIKETYKSKQITKFP